MSKAKNTSDTQPEQFVFLNPFEDRYIALSPDRRRVLASGPTLDNVVSQLSLRQRSGAHFLSVFPCNPPPRPRSIQI